MRDKSIIEKLQERGVSMSDLFGSFMEAIANLDGEDSAHNAEESIAEELAGSEEVMSGVHDPVFYCEDFPGRRFFKRGEINPEDPRFLEGFDIGIPEDVAVHSNENQGHLLPFVEGVELGDY